MIQSEHGGGTARGVGDTLVWALLALADGTVVSGDSEGTTRFWDGDMGTVSTPFPLLVPFFVRRLALSLVLVLGLLGLVLRVLLLLVLLLPHLPPRCY